LFLCAALLPACVVPFLIIKYAVDLPFGDEWALAEFFQKSAARELTAADLFAQQFEYRQFFPNLIIVALGWATGWDVRYEMLVSFLLACLVSFNLYRLGRITLGEGDGRRALVLFASNLLIFSPAQYENWLMGEQLIYFIPVACVTTCIVIAYSRLSNGIKFAACMCLATVSTFSAANGMLCWVVVFPVLAWSKTSKDFVKWKWPAALWAFGFAVNVALYFYSYRKPPSNPALTEAVARPAQAVIFFLAFTGSPLFGDSRYLVIPAALVGLLSIALFIAFGLRAIGAARDFDLSRRMTGWLMLGAYSLLTAGLVTIGRVGSGVQVSMISRYKTFSVYLLIALINLTAMAWAARAGRVSERRRTNAGRLLASGVCAFALLHLLASAVALRQVWRMEARLRQAKTCVLLVNVVGDDCLTEKVYPDAQYFRRAANFLDSQGFLRPPLVKSRRVEEFAGTNESGSRSHGVFEELEQNGALYIAFGRALLPGGARPADGVLLAYKNGGGDSVAFALAGMSNEGDILRTLSERRVDANWRGSFSAEMLPDGANEITAWAFDAETGRAYLLEGAHTIQATTGREGAADDHH
jgi:hypothetical protein